MSIKRTENGWLVDLRPDGKHGKRTRRTFGTKLEATRFERSILSGDVSLQRPAQMRLSEAVRLWYENHGQHLKDGAPRRSKLLKLCHYFSDQPIGLIKPRTVSAFRSVRLAEGVSPNTVNHDVAYFRAVLNFLSKLDVFHGDNPFATLSALRVPDPGLTYLTQPQIERLFAVLADSSSHDAYLVSELSLSSGCRWSEALNLTTMRLRSNTVTFSDTKGGKSRTVPIQPDLSSRLAAHAGTSQGNRIFATDPYYAFTTALEASKIHLPKGQRAHVLRHTFASHFVMSGGHLLTLQRLLGHSTLAMTMRYAHLAPDYMADSVQYMPTVGGGQKVDTGRKTSIYEDQ